MSTDGVNTVSKKRIVYLDSLKGIVCLLVFFGHYYYGFFDSAENVVLADWIIYFRRIVFILTDGVFTVSAFSFICGYFTSQNVLGYRDFIFYAIKRYLRFVFPIIFACLLVLVLYTNWNGYTECQNVSQIIGSSWLSSICRGVPDMSFYSALKAAIYSIMMRGDSTFDNPLWTIKPMFIGQLLLFLLAWIESKDWMKKHKILVYGIEILGCVIAASQSYVVLAVLIGGFYKKYINLFSAKFKNAFGVLIFAIVVGTLQVYTLFPQNIGTDVICWNLHVISRCVLSVLIVVSIMNIDKLKLILEQRWLIHLGKLSFSTYLLHIPIMCFVSGKLYAWFLAQNIEYTAIYLIVEGITLIVVLFVAEIWYKGIERLCDFLYIRCSHLIRKIIY